MNALIYSSATGFSVEFSQVLGVDDPVDEFLDPLVTVLGATPSQDDVLFAWREKVPALRDEMARWLELDLDDNLVRDVLRHAIINFYGDTIGI